jgi:iron complex transport system permease protein
MAAPSKRTVVAGGGLFLLLLIAIVVSATMGFMEIPAATVLQLISHALSFNGGDSSVDPVVTAVVMDVRIPRILAAVLVGGMLALCGTVFQAILLNPLADPYTLGISSGAAFGASLVIVLQVTGWVLPTSFSVPLFAFLGSIGTLFTVLALASEDRRLSSTSLILSGVIVAAILSAAIGFLKFIADEQVGIIIFWLMGSLSGISRQNIFLLLPAVLIGMTVCLFYSRDLNIMATGERAATTLGINTVRLRWVLLIICSLMTALCVSVSGIIGFVGLIVPHLLRHLLGPDNRQLIILSTLGGGLLLLVADTITRAVLPAEVPIGVLTALIGGPFFAYIFKKRQQENG